MVVNINCQLYFSCEFCDRRCQTILGQMLNATNLENLNKMKKDNTARIEGNVFECRTGIRIKVLHTKH